MATKKSSGSHPRGQDNGGEFSETRSPWELIVVTHSDIELRASPQGVASASNIDVSPLSKLLDAEGVSMEPLFGLSEEHIDSRAASQAAEPTSESGDYRLSQFYNIVAPEEQLDSLCSKLQKNELVECAYIKPPAELAAITEEEAEAILEAEHEEAINDMKPLLDSAPITPNFTARQIYLNRSPAGIDARYAWTIPGGRGRGVRVIDLEWGWRFTHEDLRQNQGGVVAGTNSSNTNHGTAVLGEISGDRNTTGITGISPDAQISAVAFSMPTARAIRIAADRLRAGDIMLLEIHRPGPRNNFRGRSDQQGYIAVEWWPDDYAAIRYATARGIIVVEAAGNGRENFDDAIYNNPAPGFPASWRNPFDTGNPSSMAVVVGAGSPPPGTHGRNHGPDRSRLGFSNYGRRVDCQGWGREVTTSGYGDLQGGSNPDEHYTDTFSGTSSASPIIVGALTCMQGILRSRGTSLLNPASAIRLLRITGSPQTDAPGRPRTQRIGNRPNLRQMISRYTSTPVRTVPLYRYWNPRIGDHFYTTNWSELGSGRSGWRYEGIQCYVFPRRIRGSVPLYRYWNPRIGDHFYTTNWRELGRGRSGWRYEGVQGYVFSGRPAGAVPLYRYWNPRIGDHFYTTNWRELGRGRSGWRYEGIQCYVFARPVSRAPIATPDAEFSDPAPELEPSAMDVLPETEIYDMDQEQTITPFQEGEKFPSIEPSVMDLIGVDSAEAEDACPTGDSFTTQGDSMGTFGANEDEIAIDQGAFGPESLSDIGADSFTMLNVDTPFETTNSFTVDQDSETSDGVTINLNIGKQK